ncbi:hypothetical protein QP938_08515 [Porticoccaceae bacterium LTM1]|nr:hypothetical protein QP938_08515 [Porticoccaceae bacterium LTM1]
MSHTTIENAAIIPAAFEHLYHPGPKWVDQRFTKDIHLPSISPLGLSITVDDHWSSDLFDGLLRELSLYSTLIGKYRSVEQIRFRGAGINQLSAAELTELVHRIGSLFPMRDSENGEFGIDLCHASVNPNTLALLKGLRFKQLRLHFGDCAELSQNDWMNKVADNIDLFSNFGFKELQCQIHLKHFRDPARLKQLLLSLLLYSPQQIELSGIEDHSRSEPNREDRNYYLGIIKLLTERGYTLLGNHVFISRDNHLFKNLTEQNLQFTPWGFSSPNIKNWFGTGIGAHGQLGNYLYRNTRSPEQYLQLLSEEKLPYQQLATNEIPNELQALLQSLFCYGKIENHTVKSLPTSLQSGVTQEISRAAEQLWLEHDSQQWHLTLSGMVFLRQFYRHLLEAMPANSGVSQQQKCL